MLSEVGGGERAAQGEQLRLLPNREMRSVTTASAASTQLMVKVSGRWRLIFSEVMIAGHMTGVRASRSCGDDAGFGTGRRESPRVEGWPCYIPSHGRGCCPR